MFSLQRRRKPSLPTILVLLAALAAASLAGAADTRTLYKYLGSDGKVVYSDKPPPRGVQFETLQVDTSKSGFNPSASGSTPAAAAADIDTRLKERKAKETEHDQLIAELQQAYDQAAAALTAAQEPREGERTQNANGTSRLNETYFNRIAEMQQKADAARDKLEAAKRGE
jgi:uncharacterized protein YeaO (DUF488 family)